MFNISAALAGLGAIHKILPVVEAIGKEVGPVVQQELADGKALWADVEKCYADIKGAIDAVKAAVEGTAPKA